MLKEDASFSEGKDSALRLLVKDAEDLSVISALTQDAVFTEKDYSWRAANRDFAILLNRFRWEDRAYADSSGRDYERVRSVLIARDVMRAYSDGLVAGTGSRLLSLLSIEFRPTEDGMGELRYTLAGDGLIRLEVECLNMTLVDVTKPYVAPSGKAPDHS